MQQHQSKPHIEIQKSVKENYYITNNHHKENDKNNVE
jgi:hypothetical protein